MAATCPSPRRQGRTVGRRCDCWSKMAGSQRQGPGPGPTGRGMGRRAAPRALAGSGRWRRRRPSRAGAGVCKSRALGRRTRGGVVEAGPPAQARGGRLRRAALPCFLQALVKTAPLALGKNPPPAAARRRSPPFGRAAAVGGGGKGVEERGGGRAGALPRRLPCGCGTERPRKGPGRALGAVKNGRPGPGAHSGPPPLRAAG